MITIWLIRSQIPDEWKNSNIVSFVNSCDSSCTTWTIRKCTMFQTFWSRFLKQISLSKIYFDEYVKSLAWKCLYFRWNWTKLRMIRLIDNCQLELPHVQSRKRTYLTHRRKKNREIYNVNNSIKLLRWNYWSIWNDLCKCIKSNSKSKIKTQINGYGNAYLHLINSCIINFAKLK